MSGAPVLQVRDLVVEYPSRGSAEPFRAVKGVSFDVCAGETLALVGESGSGKSTIGRAILGLTPVATGSVVFGGADLTSTPPRERRRMSTRLQAIFQDPYSSLNAARTVGDTLADSLRGLRLPRTEILRRVADMLDRVGLPASAAARFPKDFSGGQRQRIAIARALICGPELVVCDEAVSALDLSVQAQVLNLLSELQREMGMSYLFISHDLAVVQHVSQRVMVLYRGELVETGDAAAVYADPQHPYTARLLRSAPVPDPSRVRSAV